MSQVDKSLERMSFLMNYKMNENTTKRNSNIEYVTEGADKNMYGIIKEGTKYYIKKASKGSENLLESYDYVHGFNRRNQDEYKSYNEATKQLELRMMSLNEAYGVKKDVSTVDFNRSEKTLKFLTEEARKTINRMNQIFENSGTIGKDNTGTPEAPANASDPKKQGEPFETEAKATLDKDPKMNGTVEGATSDHDKVGDVEKKLTSDKAPGIASDPKKEGDPFEDNVTKKDIASDGESVAINESYYDDEEDEFGGYGDLVNQWDEELGNITAGNNDASSVAATDGADEFTDEEAPEYDGPGETDDEDIEVEEPVEEPTADTEEEFDADAWLAGLNESDEVISDPNASEESLAGPHGSEPVMTTDRLDEMTDAICESLISESKKQKLNESKLQRVINRMIKEEVTKLNVWGQHPRYGAEPFSTPDNKEVLAGTAKKDWNDASTKGNNKYGQKIGNAKPFDILVDNVTNAVVNMVKESLKKKK